MAFSTNTVEGAFGGSIPEFIEKWLLGRGALKSEVVPEESVGTTQPASQILQGAKGMFDSFAPSEGQENDPTADVYQANGFDMANTGALFGAGLGALGVPFGSQIGSYGGAMLGADMLNSNIFDSIGEKVDFDILDASKNSGLFGKAGKSLEGQLADWNSKTGDYLSGSSRRDVGRGLLPDDWNSRSNQSYEYGNPAYINDELYDTRIGTITNVDQAHNFWGRKNNPQLYSVENRQRAIDGERARQEVEAQAVQAAAQAAATQQAADFTASRVESGSNWGDHAGNYNWGGGTQFSGSDTSVGGMASSQDFGDDNTYSSDF